MAEKQQNSGSTKDAVQRLRERVLVVLHDVRNPLGVISLTLDRLAAGGESDELVRRLGRKPFDVIRRSVSNIQQALDALGDVASGEIAPFNEHEQQRERDDDPEQDPAQDSALGSEAAVLDAAAAAARTQGSELTSEAVHTIGLAFVHEVARLHGGDVRVAHHEGQPSTFRISIPPGANPTGALAGESSARGPTASAVATALQQALRWLPDEALRKALAPAIPQTTAPALEMPRPKHMRAGPSEGRILLAEDNAELREYVEQMLSERWTVEAIADGTSALEAAFARPPDLVLADIMMPGLDGLALVRALRADPRTASIPIVLLSAQAGREARMEGELAGADDYLVKPFSARELIARAALHLQIGRVRGQLTSAQTAANTRERTQGALLCELQKGLGASVRALQDALAVATPSDAQASGELRQRLEHETARLSELLERVQPPAAQPPAASS